ncbi:hypothetical protein MmazTMA_26840 [Methanosarcina mazei]|nr:hypothetical protein MmazTMA_26840 [Methanosarcina mazei]
MFRYQFLKINFYAHFKRLNSHQAVTAVHTFKKSGTYTISLSIKDGTGNTISTKKNCIKVK